MKKIITIILSVFMLLFSGACTGIGVTRDEPISDLGVHQCYSNQWTIVQEPTEQDEGLMRAVCADCGNTKIVILPRLDDTNYELDKKVEVCTQGGVYIYTYHIPTQHIPNDYQWAQMVAEAEENGVIVNDKNRITTLEITVVIQPHCHYLGAIAIEDYYAEPLVPGIKKDSGQYYFNPDLIVDENGLPLIEEYADSIADNENYGIGYYRCTECRSIVQIKTYR